MCNCKSANNFQNNIQKAKRLNQNSKTEYVVWSLDVQFNGKTTKESFLGTIEQAQKSGACCYFTTDLKEIQIKKNGTNKAVSAESLQELPRDTHPQLQRDNDNQQSKLVKKESKPRKRNPKTTRKRNTKK